MSLLDEIEENRKRMESLSDAATMHFGGRVPVYRSPESGTLESYYVNKGLTIELIHDVFDSSDDEPECDYSMNWLILSTSGIHGSYTTLDELEIDDGTNEDESLWQDGIATITAMIFQPRRLSIVYEGELEITRDDIPYLRKIVSKTVLGFIESQRGNMN